MYRYRIIGTASAIYAPTLKEAKQEALLLGHDGKLQKEDEPEESPEYLSPEDCTQFID
jgi:hypothetical protein